MWTVKLYRLRYLLITNLIPLLGFSKYTTIYCLIKKIDDDKYVTYRYIQCNYIIIIIIISISIFYILWAVLFIVTYNIYIFIFFNVIVYESL
jgi:hypothetical protein